MADKKTGPVKPPIIDAKARQSEDTDNTRTRAETPSTDKGKPSAASPSQASDTSKPAGASAHKIDDAQAAAGEQKPKTGSATPEPPRPAAVGTGALVVTGLGGAALGLAFAYGLAATGFWPTTQPQIDPTAALESRISDLEAAFSEISGSGAQINTQLGDLDTRLQTLETEISALGDTPPATAQSDIDALTARVDELANALSAVSAGTSGRDATQIGADIATLQDRIGAVENDLGTIAPTLDTATSDLQSLDSRIAELEAALADQPEVAEITAERDRFAQIPGTIAALERRIAAGEPFAAALANLEAILPDLDIPAPLRAASATGIASTDAMIHEFRALMPELLAARPLDPDAGFLETLMSQAQAAIALRPAGEISGNGADALLARAETALEDGDLAGTRNALTALPEPMQSKATPLIDKVNAALAARTLLDAARNAGNGNGEAVQ
ncbi:mitofilin family membrane protein [Pelagibacterium halotolerans]|uniref:COG4223 family protein n=1 Tax=Pelagibacterium halotolerans TaxID=531813 RepID=UPI00384E2758